MPARSLIIPTHERFRYAEGTIETILAVGNKIELTMSDTSSKNGRDGIVHPLLKIVRLTPGISVVSNCNIALYHAPTAGTVAEARQALRCVLRWLAVQFAVTKDERIVGADTIVTPVEIFDGIIAVGLNPDLPRA